MRFAPSNLNTSLISASIDSVVKSRVVRFSPIFLLLFLLTSWLYVISDENTFIPSGGPSFNAIPLLITTVHLPAFTQSVHESILREFNEKDFHSLILLFSVASFVLLSSYFLLYLAIRNLFGSNAGLFGTTIFHTTPAVQVVFWSSATFDFFPKVHLTEILLCLAAPIGSLKRTLVGEKVIQSRTLFNCVLFFSLIALYIRHSSVSIFTALLIFGLITKKIKTSHFLSAVLIGVVFLSLRTEAVGGFSFKSFAATSITIPGLGKTDNLNSMNKSPIPINDSKIKDFVANPNYGVDDLIVDKVHFSPPELLLPLQIRNWIENSMPYHVLASLDIEFNRTEVLFLTSILYLVAFVVMARRNKDFTLSVFIPIVLCVLLFAIFSRFSPHQDIQMQALLCIGLSSLIGRSERVHITILKNQTQNDLKLFDLKLIYTSFILVLVIALSVSISMKKNVREPLEESQPLATKTYDRSIAVDVSGVKNAIEYNALQIRAINRMTYEDSYLVLQNNSLDLIIPVNSNPSRKIAVKLERLREEPHGVLRFVASNLKNIELEFRFVSIPDLPTLLESDVGNSINPDKETEHVFISNSHAGQQEMKINLGRPTVCPTGLEFLCAVTTLRRIPFESFSSDVQCIRALNGSLVTRIRVETGGTPVGMLKFTDAQQWLCNSNDVSITKADVYIWQNLLDEPEVHIQFFMNR